MIRAGQRTRAQAIVVAAVLAMSMLAGTPAASDAVVGGDGITIQLPQGNHIAGTITDSTHTGLAGVTVIACTPAPEEDCRNDTTTGDDGSYTIHGLLPGGYVLQVLPAANADALSAWYTPAGPVANVEDATTIDASGGNVTGIDLQLDRGFRLAGTVRGPGGLALEGVMVSANGNGGYGSTSTNASGAFSIHGLPSGTYALEIHVPATLNYLSGPVVNGGIGDPNEDGTPVDLTAGDVDGIAVVTPTGLQISGTLTGTGAAGAGVAAYGAITSDQVIADGAGHWAIGGLVAGTYQIVFSQPDSGDFNSLPPLGYWKSPATLTSDADAASTIVLTTGNRSNVNATIPHGATLSGTVTGSDGPLATPAYILACSQDAGCISRQTAANGAWSFAHVGAGGYIVQAFESSHVGGYFGPGGFAESEALATTVTVGTANRGGVDLVLPEGMAMSGQVTGPGDAPLEGIEVQSIGTGGIGVGSSGRGVSAADGTFRLAGLGPDDYLIYAAAPDGSDSLSGYYDAAAPGHYTAEYIDATDVVVARQGVGTSYHAIAPLRVVDSRTPTGVAGTFAAGQPQTFQVAGVETIPADAVAVTGNVTMTGQTANGYVALTPVADSTPSVSTLNAPLGDTRANNFTAALASDGKLAAIYVGAAGSHAQVLVDVTGYFVAGSAESTYTPLAPVRVLDTRPATTVGLTGAFTANVPRTLGVAGTHGIPADAVAVTGNLTVTGQTRAGYLAITPDAVVNPTTSTLNFPLRDTRANGVSVGLDASGNLSIVFKAASGTANVLLDVTGYYRAAATGLLFYPLPPGRIMDTRAGVLATALSGKFTTDTARTLTVAGRGGVPTGARAVTGNLTVTGQTAAGYVAITQTATSSPTTSTLNFPLGDTRANGVTTPLTSSGRASAVYKSSGSKKTDLILDITGYFQ